MTGRTEPRVGIVGAGPAGLSLARLLRDRGVTNIVIFEKAERVGGKSRSYVVDGLAHELGTSYTTLGYAHTHRWIAEYGVGRVHLPRHTFVRGDGSITTLKQFVLGPSRLRASAQIARYVRKWLRFWARERSGVCRPDFNAEMSLSFRDWLAARKLDVIERAALKAIAGMGYGPIDEVPALYGLRWCTPSLLLAARLNAVYEPALGWSVLWRRMAEQFEVRLGEVIERTERDGDGFILFTNNGRHRIDHMVITTPLDECTWFELEPRLGSIARSVTWGQFTTTLVSVGGWFGEDTRTFEAHLPAGRGRRPGHILSARRTADKVPGLRRDRPVLYVVYQYGEGLTDTELLTRAVRDIEDNGGQVTETLVQTRWKYFPKLTAEAIKQGVVWEMDAIQGNRNLWFSGATFSHETVDSITDFNDRLADRMAERLIGRRPPGFQRLRQLLREW